MAEPMGPGIWRVLAPNPSAMTEKGTNSWILGGGEAPLIVDPGPEDDGHLAALMAALRGRRPLGVLVTHGHADHAGLAPRLARATGAPVLAWAQPEGSRLRPDRLLAEGETLAGEGWSAVLRHIPGHRPDHVALDDGRRLWTGDHAMGFATTALFPPEGDMGDYMASLARLAGLGPRRLLPGHGAPVEDGLGRIGALLAHRRAREADVRAALAAGPASAEELAARLYARLPAGLRRAAEATLLAQLIDLERRGLAASDGGAGTAARYRRALGAAPLDAAQGGC